MKKAPTNTKNLAKAKALIAQLPLDHDQRAGAVKTLATQDAAFVAEFVDTAGKALENVKRLNARLAALSDRMKVKVVKDRVPAQALCAVGGR